MAECICQHLTRQEVATIRSEVRGSFRFIRLRQNQHWLPAGEWAIMEDGYITEMRYKTLISGKKGKTVLDRRVRFTLLRECQLCGYLGVKRKVSARGDCYLYSEPYKGWKRWNIYSPMLCMGCWNKVRPLFQRYREIIECQRLLNKLKRTRHEQR